MKIARFLVPLCLVAAFGTADPGAAQQRSTDIPLEFPPASYDGRQYVDSRGCVYIRAGVDGATSWVPRVNRARQHLCGQTPTFGASNTRTAARVPDSAEQITLEPAQAAPVRSAPPPPVPAPQPAARPAPAPQPQVVKPAPRVVRTAPAPAPQRVVRPAAPKPAPAPAQPQTTATTQQGGCPGVSAVSRQYIGNGQGLTVRCGPQQSNHVTVIRRGEKPVEGKNVYILRGYDDSNLRITPDRGERYMVPDQVYATLSVEQETVVPAGYQRAWEDDRLNPYRAYQTMSGFFDTQAIWTNTVPRRLVATAQRHSIKPAIVTIKTN